MPAPLNLEGQSFGNWKVIKKAESKNGKTYWTCQCKECNTQQDIQTTHLRNGTYKKCCAPREVVGVEPRICPICGKEFQIIEHGYTRRFCFECSPSYGKTSGHALTITAIRQAIKRQLIKYKGGKCEICGYDRCVGALQFHHINPEDKDFEVSAQLSLNNFDMQEYYREVDKCKLVCANCHAELHEKEYRERDSFDNNKNK